MDSLFSKLQSKEDSTTTQSHDENPTKQQQPSNSELMGSAKYVAEAAKATFSNESDKVDKAKAAGAAADLLSAASNYGKLEEKGYGKHVEKAEDYLHQYQSTHSSANTDTSGHSAQGGHDSSVPSGGSDKEKSGGGYGDYMKMAEGFLKK